MDNLLDTGRRWCWDNYYQKAVDTDPEFMIRGIRYYYDEAMTIPVPGT